MMTLDGGGYSMSPTAAMTAECLSSSSSSSFSLNSLSMIKNKKNGRNQRRFSDEQIRSLETMFESESKLEPRKKLQLARELGLQPRQVGIWFQNKRARWKSKQLERDYSMLRANYNTLASQFENLKKEKQALMIQLQNLNYLLHKSTEESPCCIQAAERSIENHLDDDLGNKFNTEFATKQQQGSMLERPEHGIGLGVLSDYDSSSIKAEYFGLNEEPDLLNMMEPADSSLTSPENWCSLDSDGNQWCSLDSDGNQWWDFWS